MPSFEGNILETFSLILLGIAVATPLIMLNIRVAPILGLIDWPKARGLAEDQVPLIGASLVLISLGVLGYLDRFYNLGLGIFPISLVMAIVGFYDDRKPLSAVDKIFWQIFCAAIVVLFDHRIRESMGAQYGVWGYALTFFGIIGLMNAINFIDGIDGLAGLVLLMGAAGLIIFCHGSADYLPYYIFAAVLIGTLIPFLYFNIAKRKGFLGNIGSYFFSYLLATMHLSIKLPAPTPLSRICLLALCFLVPLSDSIMVILSRLMSFRSPFQADKGHLHHRMVQTSVPLRYILLCFGTIELVGLMAAYLLNRTPGVLGSYLPEFLCGSFVFVTAGLILFTEKASKKRIQNFLLRLDNAQPLFYFRYQVKRKDGGALSEIAMKRLEAKISAEIRISDVCFTIKPDRLFVCFATSADPLRGISTRLDGIFAQENVDAVGGMEQGEIARLTRPKKPNRPLMVRPSGRKKAG